VLVTAELPVVDLGQTTVYAPNAPGQLVGRLAARPALAGPVLAFTLKIAEVDSAWPPAPQAPGSKAAAAIPDTGLALIPRAGPGLVRAIFFVDASGDSLLSAIPAAAADSAGAWVLEAWALVDSLEVTPGMDTLFPAPVWPDTLTAWSSPVAAPDTTTPGTTTPGTTTPGTTAADTTAAGADSLRVAPADTTGGGQ
jgi:hypothetical protein